MVNFNLTLFSLSFRSYVPSQGDVAVFEAVGKPPATEFVNALRWYNHIKSYSDDEKLV